MIIGDKHNINRDQLIKIFIDKRMDINQVSPKGRDDALTALQTASLISDLKYSTFFLSKNADVTVKSARGYTALDIARKVHAKKPTADSLAVLQLLEKATAEAEAAKASAK